jgi:dipeptidyl aminopeptidase/acylaminoacyl peptidase
MKGFVLGLLCLGLLGAESADDRALGIFEGQDDVGKVNEKGTVTFDAGKHDYRITGGGDNIWGTHDAFQFAWRKVSGDLSLDAQIAWEGAGKQAHRKAGWMVRQDLKEDSPYADAVVHGDGLISLQYRRTRGGPTMEVKAAVKAPAVLRLERTGDLFTLLLAPQGARSEPSEPVGSVTVALGDPVYAGLAVCSHDATAQETAIFSRVASQERKLQPGTRRVRESSLETVSIETGLRRVILRRLDHFEAPNWFRNQPKLLINRAGSLYSVALDRSFGSVVQLDTGPARRCNNDHGFSPDGKWLAISHEDERQSLISVLPSGGGQPRKVTQRGPSYWHGWSPDGRTLAYCGERNDEFDIYTIPVEGGEETRLTTAPGLDDGPDYTPDGKYIYFNSARTGLMKLWRMEAGGSRQEQVTTDSDFADWFPHPSPDGKWLVFLSYDKDVAGHPADKDVLLRIMPLAGGKPRVLATLFGGQGTINVPSWSPDSKEVAFVSYRLIRP